MVLKVYGCIKVYTILLVRESETFENICENIYVLKCASERKRDLYKLSSFILKVKKGKAIPLQAWTGPEGSSRLRLPDFKTIVT
jgi:hypothetical protein